MELMETFCLTLGLLLLWALSRRFVCGPGFESATYKPIKDVYSSMRVKLFSLLVNVFVNFDSINLNMAGEGLRYGKCRC